MLCLGAFGSCVILFFENVCPLSPYIKRTHDLQQEEGRANPECSTCEGTGKVACVCNRWSDGDTGCSICGGSGKMACPSCHGGGTAVPIAAKVAVRYWTIFSLLWILFSRRTGTVKRIWASLIGILDMICCARRFGMLAITRYDTSQHIGKGRANYTMAVAE